MRRRIFAVTLLAAGVLAGCTKAETKQAPEPTPKRSASPLVDPHKAEQGSAERTVLGLIRYLQLNTVTLAVDDYHPRVVQALGAEKIAEALSSQLAAVSNASLGKVIEEPARRGTLVSLELTPRKGGATRYSYVLERYRGRWAVVYDTFLEGGLSYVGQVDVERRTGKQGTTEAMDAGRRAGRRYRNLFLREQGDVAGEPPS